MAPARAIDTRPAANTHAEGDIIFNKKNRAPAIACRRASKNGLTAPRTAGTHDPSNAREENDENEKNY